MRAWASKHMKHVERREPLGGYIIAHDRKWVWRVAVEIGLNVYLSQREYPSERAAFSAAKRLNNRKEFRP